MLVLQLYKKINILSIDVAVGAVASALFFARLLNVTILLYGQIALALTVWIIYTADHLRDAKKIGGRASSERHFYHQRNFKTLRSILLVAIVADFVLIFFIRKPVFQWGLALTGFVALYLVFQRSLYFLKEFFVAFLYTWGVLLPSLSVTVVDLQWFHYILISQFFLIALCNLLLFSLYDADVDLRDNLLSFVTRFGEGFTKGFLVVLFFLIFALTAVLFIYADHTIAILILWLMTAVLCIIFLFPELFRQNEYYRIVGDAIFLIPIVGLL